MSLMKPMESSKPIRRSTRVSQPNPKYSTQEFDLSLVWYGVREIVNINGVLLCVVFVYISEKKIQ